MKLKCQNTAMKEQDEHRINFEGSEERKNPFLVPDGYFETFSDRLMSRIGEEQKASKTRKLVQYLKPALSMAASFLLIMLLVSTPVKKFFNTSKGHLTVPSSEQADSTTATNVPIEMVTYLSDGQFMSAVSELNAMEKDTLSNINLGDYIEANYSDLELVAYN